jgi:clan AA aspartic protease
VKGRVDQSGRAILSVLLVTEAHSSGVPIDVWVDTGFTGDLVLPEPLVQQLGLPVSGSIDGILADGSQTELSTYHCQLRWFGRDRNLEVIANDGEVPLLGVGLLLARKLTIDYTNFVVSLEPSPRNA